MRISDWSSDVCSSDLRAQPGRLHPGRPVRRVGFAAVQLAGTRRRAQPDRRELQDRGPGVRQRWQHPDRVLRPAAQLVRVAAVQLLLSSMDAWESTAGFGPPFFVLPTRSEEHTSELQTLMRHSYA